MSVLRKQATNRREFLRNTSRAAAASLVVAGEVPHVHAAEDNTIRLALVGCGVRGTGAAADALSTSQGPTQLVAMADVSAGRTRRFLRTEAGPDERIAVPGAAVLELPVGQR